MTLSDNLQSILLCIITDEGARLKIHLYVMVISDLLSLIVDMLLMYMPNRCMRDNSKMKYTVTWKCILLITIISGGFLKVVIIQSE